MQRSGLLGLQLMWVAFRLCRSVLGYLMSPGSTPVRVRYSAVRMYPPAAGPVFERSGRKGTVAFRSTSRTDKMVTPGFSVDTETVFSALPDSETGRPKLSVNA